MDTIFPLGFPFSTAMYLVLYVLTLVSHVEFMNYVLAGTVYLGVAGIRGGLGGRDPLATILKDWMPFALSAAITAGIAPLLFVQILYQQEFYTANLLQFHRWMSILPVLIVVFYMLYILKAKRAAAHPGWRGVVGVVAALGVVFVAYSWTTNHLLSLDRAQWAPFYASKSMVYRSAEILPRLAVWALGSIPTLALLLAWQVRAGSSGIDPSNPDAPRRLALMALVGIVLAAGAGGWYAWAGGETMRGAMASPMAWPYLAAAILGLALQAGAWVEVLRRRSLVRTSLWIGTIGVAVTITGMTVVREAIRISRIEMATLLARHEHAGSVGGRWVFLFFAVLALLAMGWCVRVGARAARASAVS